VDLLERVNATRGTTLVLVTHDQEIASRARFTVALRDGRVVEGHPA
jgi:predicted ABC-type transport system involved in lysophospholipase L1 biosynthesis ATPase subunit